MPLIGPVGGRSTGGGPLWSLGVATPAAALDLSFMTPGTLPGSVTMTRGSTATYFDSTGTMQTVSGNTARWDYDPVTHALRGLLIEETRTNLLLNSATLGTQSVTVTAQAYTLSFYGTGTITLSGTSTAGPLVGTGAFPARVTQTFTPTAGSLTLTVTGSVLSAQLEAGAFATSYVPTTAAAVARSGEFCDLTPLGAWFTSPSAFTYCLDFLTYNYCTSGGGYLRWDDTTVANVTQFPGNTVAPANILVQQTSASSTNWTSTPANVALGAVHRAAATASAAGGTFAVGGSIISPNGPAVAVPVTLTRLRIGNTGTGVARVLNGCVQRVRYWPSVLSNAQLQAITT